MNRWTHLHPTCWPRLQRRYMPHPFRDEYMLGWRWGVVCGFLAGALLVLVTLLALRPVPGPYRPVFERESGLLIGWCGGPPPKTIPQYSDSVDVTWYPRCP